MSWFDSAQFRVLEQSLNATALRQKVIANNIANVDTPFFKRADVHFEELLQKQLRNKGLDFVGKRTDARHLEIGQRSARALPSAAIRTDHSSAINNNQNNVDIDYEMALQARNQLQYNALIEQINNEFRNIRTGIDGRR